MKKDKSILIATICGCHGIKGALLLKSHASDPSTLLDFAKFHDEKGNIFELTDLNIAPKRLIATFKHITDRNQAELLKNCNLYIYRSQLADDLQEDEFYYSDLIGMNAYNLNNEKIAKVKAVYDFGAGPILDLQPLKGKSFFVPFSKDVVPTVDLSDGFVTIDLDAAGLTKTEDDRSNEAD